MLVLSRGCITCSYSKHIWTASFFGYCFCIVINMLYSGTFEQRTLYVHCREDILFSEIQNYFSDCPLNERSSLSRRVLFLLEVVYFIHRLKMTFFVCVFIALVLTLCVHIRLSLLVTSSTILILPCYACTTSCFTIELCSCAHN